MMKSLIYCHSSSHVPPLAPKPNRWFTKKIKTVAQAFRSKPMSMTTIGDSKVAWACSFTSDPNASPSPPGSFPNIPNIPGFPNTPQIPEYQTFLSLKF
ncbi:hypothetical protein Bca101_026001 [Brassica carinata]